MKKYTKYSVEQFASDSQFINWVISPNEESEKFWNGVIKQNPNQKGKIEEAASLIKSIKAVETLVPQERLDKIWDNISEKQNRVKKLATYSYLRWAAVLVILIGFAAVLSQLTQNPGFEFAEMDSSPINEAQIIMADGSTKSIEQQESEIEINSSGEVIVNNDTLKITQQGTNKEKLNQVIMPYGKQSSLLLPDGTKVFINAGSRISFPSAFSGSKREIYLVGEAYFEVESNKQKPFIVHTPDIDVTVTGTKFNVSAYSDDSFAQTVLVSGVVSVSKKTLLSKTIEIKPGESALFNKEQAEITTRKVNTDNYTSWINGYIICNNDPVTSVVKKIERYYNHKIDIGANLDGITFSGKLDLKDDIQKVLESLAYASSLNIEILNQKIIIKN